LEFVCTEIEIIDGMIIGEVDRGKKVTGDVEAD
jgi:hypothetical protein